LFVAFLYARILEKVLPSNRSRGCCSSQIFTYKNYCQGNGCLAELKDHCISFPAQEDIGDGINLWSRLMNWKKDRNRFPVPNCPDDQEDFLEASTNYQRLDEIYKVNFISAFAFQFKKNEQIKLVKNVAGTSVNLKKGQVAYSYGGKILYQLPMFIK